MQDYTTDLITSGAAGELCKAAGCTLALALGLTSQTWYAVATAYFKSGSKWPWLHDLPARALRKMMGSKVTLMAENDIYMVAAAHMDYLLLRRSKVAPHPTSMLDDSESYDELVWLALRRELAKPEGDRKLRPFVSRERYRAILTENVQLLKDSLEGQSAATSSQDEKTSFVSPLLVREALKRYNKDILQLLHPRGPRVWDRFRLQATEKDILEMKDNGKLAEALADLLVIRPEDVTDKMILYFWELSAGDVNRSRLMSIVMDSCCSAGRLDLADVCIKLGVRVRYNHIRALCSPHGICKENLLWLIGPGGLGCLDKLMMRCIAAGRLDLVYWAIRTGAVQDISSVYYAAVGCRCAELAEYVWPKNQRDVVMRTLREDA
jgi:hypothetical protein